MRSIVRKEAMRRIRRQLVVLSIVGACVAIWPSNASADRFASMHCGNPVGYCEWGYNITAPGVNEFIGGTWNYWYDSYIDKLSGGQIGHGWNGSGPCFDYLDGVARYVYFTPSTTGQGCGGYLARFLQYTHGTQSYLWFDSCALQSGLCGPGSAPGVAEGSVPQERVMQGDQTRGSVSTAGQPISIMPGDFWALRRLTVMGESLKQVSLLRSRASRTYYRIANGVGADCYAVGPTLPTERRLERIYCAPGTFPRVIARSSISRRSPSPRLIQLPLVLCGARGSLPTGLLTSRSRPRAER
jgi:hypothetical protein